MKLYVNRSPYHGPYGGGAKFVNALYERFEKHIVASVDEADTILVAGLGAEGNHPSAYCIVEYLKQPSQRVKKKRIISRINDCDARKNTSNVDAMAMHVANNSNVVVFVSRWMQEYYEKKGLLHPQPAVIINGCDSECFNDFHNKLSYKVDKTHIVAHSWSDNPLKGQATFEWLDNFVRENEDYEFTFVGRTHAKLENSKHVKPLCGKELGEELSKHDVYVFASHADPGPNAVLESLSCKLPTYALKGGGGGDEFVGEDHVLRDLAALEKLLKRRIFMPNKTNVQSWDECINQYLQVLR